MTVSYRHTCGSVSHNTSYMTFQILDDGSVMHEGQKIGTVSDYGFSISLAKGDHTETLGAHMNNTDGRTAFINWTFVSGETYLINVHSQVGRIPKY